MCFIRQTSDDRPGEVSDTFTLVSSIENLQDDEHSSASLQRYCGVSDSGPVEDSEPVQNSASTDDVQGHDHDLS